MSHKTRKLSHVYTVDGLRALALFAVVIFHMWPNTMPGGFYGVVIFFVLAGFFTSRNFVLEQTDGTYPSLAKYYRKKFIRLYLPLLAMVVIVNLFTHVFMPSVYGNCIDATPSILLGYNNFYQINSGASYFEMHGNFKPFTHLWALSMEMQFYLFYPILMRLLSFIFRNNVNKVTVVLWIMSLASAIYMGVTFTPGTDPTNVYYSSLARMSAFTIGGAFAFSNILKLEKISLAKVGDGDFNGPHGYVSSLANRGFYRIGPTPFQSILALVLLIMLIIPFFVGSYQSTFAFRGGMVLYAIVTGLFVVLIYHDDLFLTPFMASKPMRLIASRSYSYYIWQYPIMMLFAAGLAHSTMSHALSNFLQLVLMVLIGEVSYRLLERGPKKRPYLQTPELTAGIAPVLGLATVIMFVTAVISPAEPSQNDADVVRQKIEEAQQLEAQRKQDMANQPPVSDNPAPTTQGQAVEGQQPTGAEGQQPTGSESTEGQQPAGTEGTEVQPPAGTEVVTDAPFNYTQAQVDKLKTIKATIIGDSVVDMTREYLIEYMPLVDIEAKISRQMTEGLKIMKEKAAAQELGDVVVIALGANGNFNSSVLDEMLETAAGRPLLFVNCVTPDPPEQPVNKKLKSFVEDHQGQNVYLVDWYGHAKGEKSYFYKDATHPKPHGAKIYDKLIMDKILEVTN